VRHPVQLPAAFFAGFRRGFRVSSVYLTAIKFQMDTKKILSTNYALLVHYFYCFYIFMFYISITIRSG
jgi:hypothetical protein